MKPCIVYLAQNTCRDVQYGRDSRSLLERSLDLLFLNYNNRFGHDVLIFHEGDFSSKDQADVAKERPNVFFKEVHFEVPSFLPRHEIPEVWTDGRGSSFGMGHRHMCDFYAYRIFRILLDLGYDWMMRMDDDSFLHDTIDYDLFEFMQEHGYRYGYRVDILESRQSSMGFAEAAHAYLKVANVDSTNLQRSRITPWREGLVAMEAVMRWAGNKLGIPIKTLFPSALRVHPYWCYYNNFFVTDLRFWAQPEVESFLQFIRRTGGTYKHRWNDLIIQAAAVQIFMPRHQIHKFDDWTYEHASTKNGALIFGGIYPGDGKLKSRAVEDFRSSYGKLKTPLVWSK